MIHFGSPTAPTPEPEPEPAPVLVHFGSPAGVVYR